MKDTTVESIYDAIMADPMNASYTQAAIPPLFKVDPAAKIVIVGQAPGRKAQDTRLFWNDPSGDRLRDWMGLSRDQFYSSKTIAQLPMDFYYPGKAKTGDLPPRRAFASKWHPVLLESMPEVELILLVGAYAQKFYLGKERKRTLTETVRSYEAYLPLYLPLVHPSPLNQGWLKKNPWFETELVPILQDSVRRLI